MIIAVTGSTGLVGSALMTALEARVLGCLIEKAATTPEAYPLTLNSAHLACNQKSNRDPIMNAEPGAVGQAFIIAGERYVALRKKLVEEQLFPVCRRCCKVELAAEPAMAPEHLVADPELSAIGAN